MTKNQVIFLLGFWIILLSFLSIPDAFRTTLLILTGIVISFLAFTQIRFEQAKKDNTTGEKEADDHSKPESIEQTMFDQPSHQESAEQSFNFYPNEQPDDGPNNER